MARITRSLGKKREKREETKQMSLRVPTDISDLFDRYAEEDEVSVTQIEIGRASCRERVWTVV